MLATPENKLLQRLLDSPMAQEMLRSETDSSAAVRQRARDALETISFDRANTLSTKARELADACHAAKAAYEAAKIAADKASLAANLEREKQIDRQVAFRNILNASAEWLRSHGLSSVVDLERAYGLPSQER